ncbi:DUF2269 family protein [Solibacillus sp. CAU 1738]|uniref:DUF2269 family protein n=1 Tax=Solibacillus sp. CAU 1738 TaxID=3140363 RepID=UPI0032612B6A
MYQLILFLHILGVLFMFAAVGATLIGMFGMLHSKDNKTLKIWASLTVKMDEFLPFSVILILLPGLYLVFSTWGWNIAWVNVSLVALILMSLAGPIINLRRFKGILKAVIDESGETPSTHLLAKVRDQVLWNSISIMTMEVLGIIYLMTIKPPLIESLVTMVVCFVLGIIFSKIALSIGSEKNKMSHSL